MSAQRWTERGLRESIVKSCAALFQKNLVAATDGNVSARLGPDRVLITPSNVSKGDVKELDIVLCDMDGRKVRGRGEISSEVQVHLAAYRAREDIGGVVHAHPPLATAMTFAGLENLLLEPLVPEVIAQIGPIPTVPYITPGTRMLSEAVGAEIAKCDIVMLSQHGAVAVGRDPWAAFLRMEKLEYLASIIKHARDLHAGSDRIRRLEAGEIEQLKRSYKPNELRTGDAASMDDLVEKIVQQVLQKIMRP
jgi:L-fuculose-phosphate aldolase